MRRNRTARSGPPKFAIANGFWVGQLPAELQNASISDIAIVSPVRKVGHFVLLTTGRQRQLRGHVYSTRLDTEIVARSLPLNPSDVPLRVVLEGPYTDRERDHALRSYSINRERVRGLLRFFKAHGNPHYRDIRIDADAIAILPENGPSRDQIVEAKSTAAVSAVGPSTGGPSNGLSTAEVAGMPMLTATTFVRAGVDSADSVATAAAIRQIAHSVPPEFNPDEKRAVRTFDETLLHRAEFDDTRDGRRTVDLRPKRGGLADVAVADRITYRCGDDACPVLCTL